MVTSILDIAGDGLVPDHRFSENLEYEEGHKINIGIWSDRIVHDEMTYGIVKDALIGFWYFMVTDRYAFKSTAYVSHGDLGIVAYASIRDTD